MDINEIKVAIFDFDQTLAMHKDKDYPIHRRESEEKRLEYYLTAYKNPDTFYDTIEPCEKSEELYNLICKLREKNVKVYCVSGAKYTFHLKAKQAFVNKHYGKDIEVIFVSANELKIDGVRIIQKYHHCKLDEILFVDDKKEVIEMMSANGVKALLVDDIKRV